MSQNLAITSISLGRSWAGHDFVHKMNMAQRYGYRGLELFHEDLAAIAKELPGGLTKENELEAARTIYRVCRERGIEIICLQPFWHYEGLIDRSKHEEHIEKLKFWFKLARTLGTDMIQIPSNFLPADQLSTDPAVAIADLQKAADMGLAQQPPVRFVYEALAWGTQCDTWERSWEIVQEVDRPNFGLCLDTFNIAGRVWADPSSPTGCTENADQKLAESLRRMIKTVDVKKLYCVQVVDAERLASPLVEGHEFYDADQPNRMSWSRNCRLFYGEKDRGAYLPVERVSRAIFRGLGYDGWVSVELFNRRMGHEDPDVPRELAARGAASYKKLLADMKAASAPKPVHKVAPPSAVVKTIRRWLPWVSRVAMAESMS